MSFRESRPQLTKSEMIIHDEDIEHRYTEFSVELMSKFPQGADSSHKPFIFHTNITAGANDAFPKFNNLEEAVNFFDTKFVFPATLREEAQALSCELMYILQAEHNPRVMRRQQTGKLDMNAMSRTMRDIELGRFSSETTRPFKQRLKDNASRPSIGIVVQGNPSFMWANENNIPNVVRSALAISWAAQAINCNVNAFLCQQFSSRIAGKIQHENIQFISSNESISLKALGAMFHRDFVRGGRGCARVHHKDVLKYKSSSDGDASLDRPSKSISFIKEYYKSDIIIAIGSHAESGEADIHIPNAKPPAELIKEVAEILGKKLEMKRAA